MADAPRAVKLFVLLPVTRQTDSMMFRMIMIFLAGFVASCAPLNLYYKQGVSFERLQSDQLACEVKALNEAPVATQVRQAPPRYYPGQRYCNSAGHCYRGGGFWVPGEVYSYDANRSLRARVENQCMAAKGYQPVEIEQCAQSVAAQVDTARTEVLPPLTERTCAIKNSDGSWQIISVN